MTKIKLLLACFILVFASCNSKGQKDHSAKAEKHKNVVSEKQKNTAENSETDKNGENKFGKDIDKKGAMTVGELMEKMNGKDSLYAKVRADVNAVCQKKGCWMDVKLPNGEEMKVRFKDYGFFVPKDIAGDKVVMEGLAKIETVSVDDLKHYAKDAGKTEEEITAIDHAEERYTFTAEGVIIEK